MKDIDVLEMFKKYFKKYYDIMCVMSHAYNNDNENYPSIWHRENEIWNHTKMVYDYCVENYESRLDEEDFHLLKWMCLLHDIGKPLAMEENHEKKKRHFHNHFNFSYYITLDMLSFTKEEKEEVGLTDSDIKLIAETVLNHHARYDSTTTYIDNSKLLNWITMLSDCDIHGRISDTADEKLALFKLGEFKSMDDKKPTISILIGPPCSGKSTYLRYRNIEDKVLSRDSIVMELSGKDNYNDAWDTVDQEAVDNELMKRYYEYVKAGEDFIIDMTNMSKKSRKKWRHKDFNIKAYVFMVGYDEIKARNIKRNEIDGKLIPEKVFDYMIKSLKVNYKDEFNEIEFVRA